MDSLTPSCYLRQELTEEQKLMNSLPVPTQNRYTSGRTSGRRLRGSRVRGRTPTATQQQNDPAGSNSMDDFANMLLGKSKQVYETIKATPNQKEVPHNIMQNASSFDVPLTASPVECPEQLQQDFSPY